MCILFGSFRIFLYLCIRQNKKIIYNTNNNRLCQISQISLKGMSEKYDYHFQGV